MHLQAPPNAGFNIAARCYLQVRWTKIVDIIDEHYHRALLCCLHNFGYHDRKALLVFSRHLTASTDGSKIKLENLAPRSGKDITAIIVELDPTTVLPTPGEPRRTGLFLVRRLRIWASRRSSSSRPIKGSSIACRASSVTSVQKRSRAESSSSCCTRDSLSTGKLCWAGKECCAASNCAWTRSSMATAESAACVPRCSSELTLVFDIGSKAEATSWDKKHDKPIQQLGHSFTKWF